MGNQKELVGMSEIFESLLEPYEKIMMRWVENGELVDPHQEFFIKANTKHLGNVKSTSDQW